jgi:drug/metabolite transporter (DMT)-like permease
MNGGIGSRQIAPETGRAVCIPLIFSDSIVIERKPIDATAVAIMVVLCAIWGAQQVPIKLVAAAMSPILQMGLRSGLAALATLCVIFWRGDARAINRHTVLPGLAIGALFGTEFVMAGEALRFTSASHVTIYLIPLPSARRWGSGCCAVTNACNPRNGSVSRWPLAGSCWRSAGAGMAHYPQMRLGDALALAGACGWACTSMVLRNSAMANAPASVALFFQLSGAFVLCTMLAPVLGETRVTVTTPLIASLAFQVIVVAFASYLCWYSLLRRYSASRLGVLTFMTPMFGVASGVVLLGDRLDAAFIGGALLIGHPHREQCGPAARARRAAVPAPAPGGAQLLTGLAFPRQSFAGASLSRPIRSSASSSMA